MRSLQIHWNSLPVKQKQLFIRNAQYYRVSYRRHLDGKVFYFILTEHDHGKTSWEHRLSIFNETGFNIGDIVGTNIKGNKETQNEWPFTSSRCL